MTTGSDKVNSGCGAILNYLARQCLHRGDNRRRSWLPPQLFLHCGVGRRTNEKGDTSKWESFFTRSDSGISPPIRPACRLRDETIPTICATNLPGANSWKNFRRLSIWQIQQKRSCRILGPRKDFISSLTSLSLLRTGLVFFHSFVCSLTRSLARPLAHRSSDTNARPNHHHHYYERTQRRPLDRLRIHIGAAFVRASD